MDEQLKAELNFALIAFTQAALPRERVADFSPASIAEAFLEAHPGLIARTGARPEQIRRMVHYVLAVPCASDPWSVAEYDLNQLTADEIVQLSPRARQHVESILALVEREATPARAERERIIAMLDAVFEDAWPETAEECLAALQRRYWENRGHGVREAWMGVLEQHAAAWFIRRTQ
jgi:hypothetical protein